MAKILVAEDDRAVSAFVVRALAHGGHEVVAVPDGLAALTRLAELPFDLLLTDIVMPGMNGMALARIGRRLRPTMRVLYTSGYWPYLVIEPDDRDIVRKPYVPSQLVAQVRKSLVTTELGQVAS
jgi:two-component system, cell cycle response regulator CpdR